MSHSATETPVSAMTRYPPDTPVEVRPYLSRRDGDTAVIGDDQRQVYLSVPIEGLDILEWLAAGHTVEEAARRYEEKYHETPDIEPFLDALAEEGFVVPPTATVTAPEAASKRPRRRVWNLDWVSQETAQRLLSAPVMVVCALIVLTAAALVVSDPSLMPGESSLRFHDHFWAYLWTVMILALVGVVLHELAHVLAARRVGVRARMEIGNQLYIMVAQTDMSGVWLLPRRKRYFALLAGVLFDIVSSSLLIIVLWLDRSEIVPLPEPVRIVLAALIFTYVIRLIVQCYMFVRTDLYYAVATALNCKSLMADTEAYLLNLVRRVRRSRRLIDQSGIKRREMWSIRLFAVLWVVGRFAAIASLAFITVPLLIFYGGQVVAFFAGGSNESGFTWPDMLSLAVLFILFNGGGIVMWVRSLLRTRRRRRLHPDRVLVS
ncbi:hypothetical protein GCM10022226_72730 [Sphaerisporangium flaviroseum]|uniref:PqqD family protein n=1 Tax=Sphaerisporangium flaviroseum TaxID=509199 RepID=A0ABP7JB64_9ACTN